MGERGPTATIMRFTPRALHCTRWENGGQPQLVGPHIAFLPLLYPMGETGANRNSMSGLGLTGPIVPDGRTGANRNMGEERRERPPHCTRWENGGQPQPCALRVCPVPNCTRWENGGQPQHGGVGISRHYDCTRWENGGQPQHGVVCSQHPGIVPDGRTGANRNRAGTA